MKTYRFLFHGCCLAAALLTAIPLTGQTIKDSRVFKARRQTNITQSLSRAQTTVSDTIPLQDLGAIYAFSIDATISQPREASFVRIVLEDTEGHDYLVAESDRFRNDTSIVQLSEYCEETAKLPGIIPLRLKCYLAGDATLQFTSYHASDQEPTRGQINNEETVEAIKEAQVQSIVDRINEYNIKNRKLWEAGKTPIALMTLEERKQCGFLKDEPDPYLTNLNYYIGGLYEIGEPTAVSTRSESLYVDSFDWRHRHGQDWITIPKNQWSSSWCTEFAVAGTIESYVNLYYNQHLNLDLSEPYLAYKCGQGFNVGNNNSIVFSKAKTYGVIDEDSYPFVDDSTQQWPITEPSCTERVFIDNYSVTYSFSGNDALKHTIINHGPCATSFNVRKIINGEVHYPGHAFGVVGYGKVTPNIMYFFLKSDGWEDTLLQADDYRIGMDYWICKDSYYNHPSEDIRKRYQGHEGYMYIICHTDNRLKDFYYPTGPIQCLNYTDDDIHIEDIDGDGFFNWGIGPRPNNKLPAWAEQEEDGDDSSRYKGAQDEYGYLSDVSYPSSTFIIDHNMTDTELADSIGSRFVRRAIRINSGVTLTINGDLAFYAGKKIYMNQNSTLKIDGGTLVDPTLYKSGTGCIVKILNGGKIQRHKKSDFALPYGISLEMDEGSIFE